MLKFLKSVKRLQGPLIRKGLEKKSEDFRSSGLISVPTAETEKRRLKLENYR